VTALQIAKAECANCDSVGHCSGVGIVDDLSCYMFRRPGKCYLAEQPIRRCYGAPAQTTLETTATSPVINQLNYELARPLLNGVQVSNTPKERVDTTVA
jgi:hypothetical protein